MLAVLQKDGHKAPKYLELQKKVLNELMQIRFSARQVEKLCDSVRHEVDNIRQIERKIQDLVVNKAGMPRPEFIRKFPENEVSLRWIEREVAAAHPYSEQLAKYRQAIVEQQQKLLSTLGTERIATLINEMDPDDRTALFEDLPGNVVQEMINTLSAEERAVAIALLGKWQLKERSHTPCWLALAVSFAASLVLLTKLLPAGFAAPACLAFSRIASATPKLRPVNSSLNAR